MAKFDWRSIIRTVAPALGTVLGGPLAGMAVKAIGDKLLGNPKATEADIADAMMNATPADLLKLKELDQQFAKDMKALDVDIFKLEVSDVQSARAMYTVNYWPQIVLSALYVGGYFIILAMFIRGKVVVQAEMRDTVTVLIGMLTTAIPIILGFWFGSSYGSREKTAALALSKPADS